MNIAIVGDGVAGRALYRFLELDGFSNVDIYGLKQSTKCGISPCGWAVCTNEFYKALNALHIRGETTNYKSVQVGDTSVKCDLSTFDKPSFLHRMCPKSKIKNAGNRKSGDHDLIVDATGTARALLPPIKEDLTIICRQQRYKVNKGLGIAISPSDSIGYSWLFPLENMTVHIGSSFVKDADANINNAMGAGEIEMMKELAGIADQRPICTCRSEIRMLSPKRCEPIIHGKIVGIGEAVGTVSPLCGAGIIPSIQSARLLADNIDNKELYAQKLIKKFSYLDREVTILRKITTGKNITAIDMLTMRGNAAKFGIFYGWKDAIKTVKLAGGKIL